MRKISTESDAIKDEESEEGLTDLQRVQKSWQMASCGHFIETFAHVLPFTEICPDGLDGLDAISLERAVAEPETSPELCLLIRDVLATLFFSLGQVSKKSFASHWFEYLRKFIVERQTEFPDCFHKNGNCILRDYKDGIDFLVAVGWHVRLGLLLSLCDIVAEESDYIRDALRDKDSKNTEHHSKTEGYRLAPLGKCSKRRYYYMVGKSRIYSGYKRKGYGILRVECSSHVTMNELIARLNSTGHGRDALLASTIENIHLEPLAKYEEEKQRNVNTARALAIAKEKVRQQNARRHRRLRAGYNH